MVDGNMYGIKYLVHNAYLILYPHILLSLYSCIIHYIFINKSYTKYRIQHEYKQTKKPTSTMTAI